MTARGAVAGMKCITPYGIIRTPDHSEIRFVREFGGVIVHDVVLVLLLLLVV